MVNAAGETVKVRAFEVLPPGFATATAAVPGEATSVAGIAAVNWDALTNVVVRFDPSHLTVEPETGMNIEMHTPDGTIIPLTVTEVSETSITLDANHPLAGRELHFSVALVEITS